MLHGQGKLIKTDDDTQTIIDVIVSNIRNGGAVAKLCRELTDLRQDKDIKMEYYPNT